MELEKPAEIGSCNPLIYDWITLAPGVIRLLLELGPK